MGSHPITGADRNTIVNYLVNKYGDDYVASVGNRLIYSAKSVIRDLGTTYEIPASETFKCSKEYDDEFDIYVNIRRSKAVAEYFAKYPELKSKIDQLCGTVSSLGVHAGGVIISDQSRGYSLRNYCALQRTKDDSRIATLWTKEEIAQLGFIKYDLLGLNSASMVHYARQILALDPYEDAPEDEEVFRDVVLCLKHKNIFQFESQLGRTAFEDFMPMSIAELANATAVIRLIGAKAGREVYNDYKTVVDSNQQGNTDWWKERLYDECVEEENAKVAIDVMKDSYGVLIFQEQLSNLVKDFSKGEKTFTEGNHCRKRLDKHKKKYGTIDDCQGDKDAILKWHKTFMEILDEYFMPYLGKDGYDSPDEETQNFLKCKLNKDNTLDLPRRGPLKWILSSAAYLFNKIHAIAYSINSYNMMWLKHYYPLEFWTASLTCVKSSLDQIRNFISTIDVENPEISILSPNVNESNMNFKIEKNNIRYGLESINGLGAAADIIISERRQNGKYKSIQDFVDRLKGTKVNKRTFNALVYSNAFSDFGDIDFAYEELTKLNKDIDAPTTDMAEMATKEATLIGTNLIYQHPILNRAAYYVPLTEIVDGSNDTAAMRILKITKKTTKTGKPYQMLKAVCLNSGKQVNLFEWQNRDDLAGQEYLIGRVAFKNNFYTLLGPSSAPGKKFIAKAKKFIKEGY